MSDRKKQKAARTAGFSQIDMLITALFLAAIAAMAIPMLRVGIREAKADAAEHEVVAYLRLARNYAIDQRRTYRVTFTLPDGMRLERRELDNTWNLILQETLSGEVKFRVEPGVPTTDSGTPDALGADAAIDFAGSNQVFFNPEGFATDGTGQMVNGIVYLAVPGYLETSRAVTLFGGTGRARGWALRKSGEEWAWD